MAATDITTLARAKTHLNVGGFDVAQDAEIVGFVTTASERIDEGCGPVIQRTVTEVFAPHGSTIHVARPPIAEVTSVKTYAGGIESILVEETLLAVGDFTADLKLGRLVRRSGWADQPWASRVQVVYKAGRYATTAAAQGSKFETATLMLVSWLMGSQSFGVAPTGDYDVPVPSYPRTLPRVVIDVLAGDWFEKGAA